MYYKCSICKKGLKPQETIKLVKAEYGKYKIIPFNYFCDNCYKIFEQRLKDYLLK